MRIRTQRDVNLLDKRIKSELGIDVQQYRDEAVIENFMELLVFPQYVLTWTIKPIQLSLFIFVVGFFIIDLVHIEYLIYTFLGSFLFLLLGVLSGLLFLTRKMQSDMLRIMKYTLDIMQFAVKDLNKVHQQINRENRKKVLGLLFKGILHIVTIPILTQAISEKVPLVGGLTSRLVKRILTTISDSMKFDDLELTKELKKGNDEPTALQIYTRTITGVSKGLNRFLSFAFEIAQFPLKIGTSVSFLMLILFIYLIW